MKVPQKEDGARAYVAQGTAKVRNVLEKEVPQAKEEKEETMVEEKVEVKE